MGHRPLPDEKLTLPLTKDDLHPPLRLAELTLPRRSDVAHNPARGRLGEQEAHWLDQLHATPR